MKRLTSALAMGAFLVTVGAAGARQPIESGADFLSTNEEQKEIYVSQLMDGNRALLSNCDGDTSAKELASYLTEWLDDHPTYLMKTAHHAFTRAVTDRCGK